MKYEQEKELVNMQGAQAQELKKIEFENEMAKVDSQNKAKIVVAQLTAQGRAADKQSDTASFDEINATAKNALTQQQLDDKRDYQNKQVALTKERQMSQKEIEILKLKQKAEELRTRAQMKKDDVTIAAINKN